MPRTPTPTLIAALRVLASEIQSPDGVANAAIAEAADRLEEMSRPRKPKPPEPTPSQLRSACLSYRHDYGIMDEQARESLRFTAMEWLRAWQREGVL